MLRIHSVRYFKRTLKSLHYVYQRKRDIQTSNGMPYNNRNNLPNLSFILKISIFSITYLESSRTLMKLFAKMAESR